MILPVLGVGSISLLDLNDAIVSGTPPANPTVGTLWIDESQKPSKLKKWNGTEWIDLGDLDPDFGETLTFISTTLGNMANDNLIDFSERKTIKEKINEIIGYNISDSARSLPTTSELDASGKGDFWSVRKGALNAGIPATDSQYVAVATKYNDLKSYLEGLVPQPTFTRNSVAYKSDGTQVSANQPRFENGGILIEEGTVNLVPNPIAKIDSTAISSFGPGRTLERVTSLPSGLGITTGLKFTVTTSGDNNIMFLQTNGTENTSGIPVSANTTYSFSAWVYIESGLSVALRPIEYNSSGGVVKDNNNLATTNKIGQWIRLNGTLTTQSSTARISFRILATGTGVVYVTGAQLEQKPYATSFVDGTRQPETLTLPTSGVLFPEEGTIEMELEVPYINNYNNFFQMAGLSNGRFLLFFNNSRRVIFDYGAYNQGVNSSDNAISPNTKTFIAMRWSGKDNSLALFVNGNKYTRALPSGVASAFQSTVSIVNSFSATIYNLRISKIARPDDDILKAYQEGLTIDNYTTAYFDFENNINNIGTVWDTSDQTKDKVILVNKEEFRNKWLDYYNAVNALAQATAQKLKDNVDNLNIGGRNLLRNTGDFKDLTYWWLGKSANQQGLVEIVDDSVRGKVLHATKPNHDASGWWVLLNSYYLYRPEKFTVDKEYTLSLDIKTSVAMTVTINFRDSNGQNLVIASNLTQSISTPNTWNRYTFTFKATATGNQPQLYITIGSAIGELWLDNVKLEEGNKPTDWTPAPEDIDETLSNLDQRIYQVEQQITDQAIINKVTSSQAWLQQLEIINGTDGRNIVRSSGSFNTVGEWRTSNESVMKLSVEGEELNIEKVGTATNVHVYVPLTKPIVANKRYTLTIRLKCNVNKTGFRMSFYKPTTAYSWFNLGNLTANQYVTLTSTITATSNDVNATHLLITSSDFNQGDKLTISWLKLEEGARSTPWSPAPEDAVDQISLLINRVSEVEQKITADGIFTTITDSVNFQNLLESLATQEDLGNYASKGDLDDLSKDFDEKLSQALSNIDFSPYVTKLELEETSRNITAKFSAAGGMNLIKNSVGYAGTSFWVDATGGKIQAIQNSELDKLGFGSGFQWNRSITANGSLLQSIAGMANQVYTLSWYINVQAVDSGGYFKIRIINLDEGGSYVTLKEITYNAVTDDYVTQSETFTTNYSTILLQLEAIKVDAIITGLMLNIGDIALSWSLATGEMYNRNIRMDINGIRVSQLDSDYNEIGYTQITPDEFAGYYDTTGNGNFEKIFYLNGEETVTKKFRALNEINMGQVKVVNIDTTNRKGWAFVPI